MTRAPYIPEAGDIIWLVFDPRIGHEQSGRRPALVLSPRVFTERTSLAIVCPVTSKIKKLPFEIVLSKTKTKGAVLPIHVRSVDIEARKAQYIETVPPATLDQVRQFLTIMITGLN